MMPPALMDYASSSVPSWHKWAVMMRTCLQPKIGTWIEFAEAGVVDITQQRVAEFQISGDACWLR
jgi:hypothetical protein